MPSKPATVVARRFLSGAVQRSGRPAGAPVSRPATAPAVAPLESVSQPPDTRAADGAGEVAVRVGEGGGDQRGVVDRVDPV